ncbi:MAG: beta strand repeat-containing protein [Candidatus Nanopelagicales bacterium]
MAAPQFPFVEQVRGEWDTAKGYLAEGLEQLNAGLEVWAPAGNATSTTSNSTPSGNSSFANNANHANTADYATNAGHAIIAESATSATGALIANNASFLNTHTEAQLNVNSALTANQANTAGTANNATFAFGKTEGTLNVNSALTSNTTNLASFANNASYLNGHTESQLNANSALVANNATFAFGKTEGTLNVNAALGANNSGFLNTHTEAQLNVNSALTANQANTAGTANNSTYAFGKTEGTLNVNSALGANNATYAFGKTEGTLNVNSALGANNSGYLSGHTEAQLNVNSALSSNTTNSATFANNSSYLNTHTEAQLNVNSALGANNSGFLNTHTEAQLNVNNALTSNNSTNFGGQGPAFYTNSSNANTGTLPDARLSANVVRYQTAQTANYFLGAPSAANGNITFRALTSKDVKNLDERVEDMNPYGFPHHETDTTLSFNANTYTVTLGNAVPVWQYFVAGIEYDVAGPRSVTLPGAPPANGVYYIHIAPGTGANANLVANATIWALADDDGIVPVAVVLWNSSLTPKFFFGDERHSPQMSRAMHRYLHTTLGTRFVSGGELSGQTFNSSVNTALTFAVANSVLLDEDETHQVNGLADGDGATNNYTIVYRSNTSNWVWERSAVPFRYTANGYVQYDANGTMTEGATNKYYNTYLLATSLDEGEGGNTGWILIPGWGEFSTQVGAEAESPLTFDFTGFQHPETVILYQLTWNTSAAFGTKGHVQFVAIRRVNIPVSTASVGTTTQDHNNLSALQGGAPGEYYHITAAQWNGGSLLANVANNASYLNTHTEAQLNVNSALTANSTTYVKANTGIVSNASGVFVNAAYINTIAANTALTANNSTNAFGKTEGNLNVNSALTANSTTYVKANTGIVSNASGVFVNAAYINTIAANSATYVLANTGVVSNASGVFVNAAYINTLASNTALTANNSTYAYGKTEGTLSVNNATNLAGKAASTYLGNVVVANTANGDIVRFNVANSTWYNTPIPSGANISSSYLKLDTLAAQFNGAQTVFTLQSSSANVVPVNAQQLFIALGGIMQEPVTAYSVSGSLITFTSAPYAGTPFFGTILGQQVDVGNITPGVDINPRNVTATGNLSVAVNASIVGTLTLGASGNTINSSVWTGLASTANNATFAFGKTEGNLNANSALNANNLTGGATTTNSSVLAANVKVALSGTASRLVIPVGANKYAT